MSSNPNSLVESLEQRRLLSASLHGGLLAIKGTSAANDIEIEVEHRNVMVTMDGVSKSFALDDVRRIRAVGGRGNDDIHFNSAGGKLTVPMQLLGGAGDDTLIGASGKDNIKGGGGDDSIEGAGGDDNLHGDDGDDSVSGGAGDDSIGGSDGNDDLNGDRGDDSINGGAGNDDCHGGKGHDNLKGGKGRDHFHDDDAENEIEDKHGNDDDDHDDNGGGDGGSDDVLM